MLIIRSNPLNKSSLREGGQRLVDSEWSFRKQDPENGDLKHGTRKPTTKKNTHWKKEASLRKRRLTTKVTFGVRNIIRISISSKDWFSLWHMHKHNSIEDAHNTSISTYAYAEWIITLFSRLYLRDTVKQVGKLEQHVLTWHKHNYKQNKILCF